MIHVITGYKTQEEVTEFIKKEYGAEEGQIDYLDNQHPISQVQSCKSLLEWYERNNVRVLQDQFIITFSPLVLEALLVFSRQKGLEQEVFFYYAEDKPKKPKLIPRENLFDYITPMKNAVDILKNSLPN